MNLGGNTWKCIAMHAKWKPNVWIATVSLIIAILIDPVSSQNFTYNVRAVDCVDGFRGYSSLTSLQQDIDEERSRVLAGAMVENEYEFTLCPSTTFVVSDALVPALDEIRITCGLEVQSQSNCFFVGGNVQVDVQGFQDSSFPVEFVTLQGIVFENFTDAALAGSATDATQVVLITQDFR